MKLARAISIERQPTRMNKTEQEFASRLESLRQAGEIKWWGWEVIQVKITEDRHRYTPDFMVVENDDTITMYDTKGQGQSYKRRGGSHGIVKMKDAAARYPMFRWILVKKRTKKQGGGWEERQF